MIFIKVAIAVAAINLAELAIAVAAIDLPIAVPSLLKVPFFHRAGSHASVVCTYDIVIINGEFFFSLEFTSG